MAEAQPSFSKAHVDFLRKIGLSLTPEQERALAATAPEETDTNVEGLINPSGLAAPIGGKSEMLFFFW